MEEGNVEWRKLHSELVRCRQHPKEIEILTGEFCCIL